LFGHKTILLDKLRNASQKSVSLAVCAILCVFHISPIAKEAEELVASHMGTLYAVSETRRELYVRYGSEPALAEASSYELDQSL
jgi:hypothetical protein